MELEFAKVLNPKTITTHLKATNKAEALQLMADMLLQASIINDKETYLKDVYLREEVGETGIGNHIAIPHGRSKAVVTPGVAVAILEDEVEWESLDETGAKVVILFAVGDDSEGADEHLRLLAMFSKRLGNDAVVHKLMEADTTEEVLSAFLEEDNEFEDDADEADLDMDEISIL